MKKIKIIGGRYGYISPTGDYSVKTTESAPFDVEDNEAERLFSLHVAEPAEVNASAFATAAPDKVLTREADPDAALGMADETDIENEVEDGPAYDENSTIAELQAIAKEYGVELPRRATKEMALKALNEFFSDSPDLSVEEPQ